MTSGFCFDAEQHLGQFAPEEQPKVLESRSLPLEEYITRCGLRTGQDPPCGRGLLADRDFPAGHILCYDTPTHGRDKEDLAKRVAEDLPRFSTLTTGPKGTLGERVAAAAGDRGRVAAACRGAVEYNCFQHDGGVLLFHHFSLVNHACPASETNNCCLSSLPAPDWDRPSDAIKLVATRDIKKGAPLRFSYFQAFAPEAAREAVLRTHCGGACGCSQCAAPDPALCRLVREPSACKACGEEPAALRACSACLLVGYCGRECQKRDWRDHRDTCRSGATLDQCVERREADFREHLARVLSTASAMPESFEECSAAELYDATSAVGEFLDEWLRPALPAHAARHHQAVQVVLAAGLSLVIKLMLLRGLELERQTGRRSGESAGAWQGRVAAAQQEEAPTRDITLAGRALCWIRWRQAGALSQGPMWSSEHWLVLLQARAVMDLLPVLTRQLAEAHPVCRAAAMLHEDYQKALPVVRVYKPGAAATYMAPAAGLQGLSEILDSEPALGAQIEAVYASDLPDGERAKQLMQLLGPDKLDSIRQHLASISAAPPPAATPAPGADGGATPKSARSGSAKKKGGKNKTPKDSGVEDAPTASGAVGTTRAGPGEDGAAGQTAEAVGAEGVWVSAGGQGRIGEATNATRVDSSCVDGEASQGDGEVIAATGALMDMDLDELD